MRLNNIDNSSNDGPNCFDDFTSQTIIVGLGNTYDLGVTVFEDDYYVSAWIDYNQNFVFDASELVVDAFYCPNATVESITPFILGVGTTQGTFRMRFRAIWDDYGPLDPCGPISYGETEDYMIEIGYFAGVDELNDTFGISLYTNNNNDQIAIIDGAPDDYNVRVIDVRGRILKREKLNHNGGKSDYVLPTQHLVSGTYMIFIENSKGDRLTEKFVIVK